MCWIDMRAEADPRCSIPTHLKLALWSWRGGDKSASHSVHPVRSFHVDATRASGARKHPLPHTWSKSSQPGGNRRRDVLPRASLGGRGCANRCLTLSGRIHRGSRYAGTTSSSCARRRTESMVVVVRSTMPDKGFATTPIRPFPTPCETNVISN